MGALPALQSLIGGVLIGLAATLLMRVGGRVAGVSGIVAGLLWPRVADSSWRAAFVAGLIVGGAILQRLFPAAFPTLSTTGIVAAGVGGFLVGIGAQLANGCTSGHGVCGMARGNPRSVAATLAFMCTGMLTVYLLRHLRS